MGTINIFLSQEEKKYMNTRKKLINGISMNGLEYLLDENSRVKEFTSKNVTSPPINQ
jgi:hypothetical protein